MKEIWKDVKDYEGIYQVSNLGKVRSLDRVSSIGRKLIGRELKQLKTSGGYFKVSLSKKSKVKQIDVHRLVALTFIPKELHNEVVDHINRIKTDNRLSNLQFITNRVNVSKDRKDGTSKYTGVSWNKNAKKWCSNVQIKGKRIHLGYFDDEYEAHLAYQNKLKTI